MLIWFLWPVAQCSWRQFKDTPLPEVEHHREFDREATDDTPQQGFFASFYDSASACYDDQPISEQASWKRNLFYSLLFLGVFSALLHRVLMRRRPTGY